MAITTSSPYETLGLSNDASPAAIRSAYKKLILQCHPDKVHDQSLREEKAIQFQRVQEAYELLSDPRRKLKYDSDAKLAAETASSGSRSNSKEEKHRDKPSPSPSKERERRQERSSSSKSYDDYHRETGPRETRGSRERENREHREREHREREHREREYREHREARESPVKEPRERRESRAEPRAYRERKESPRVHKEAKENPDSKEPASRQESTTREKEPESDPEVLEIDLKDEPSSAPKPKPQPPTAEALKLHLSKYEEEKAKEEIRIKQARAKWTMSEIGVDDMPRPSPLGRRHSAKPAPEEATSDKLKCEKEDLREQARLASEKEHRERERVRETVRMTVLPEEERKHAEEAAAYGRRGSAKERDRSGSPKDEATPARERKGSRTSPVRRDSMSPTRDGNNRPSHTPYGSAPPQAGFGSFVNGSPGRRRHSVSSPDPAKSRFCRPEDSGYSSPIHNGAVPVDINNPNAFVRNSAEGQRTERGPGWTKYTFEVFVRDELEARGAGQRRKTTSNHPAESASYVGERSPPMVSGEFSKAAQNPSPISPSAYAYPSQMGYYPTSPYGQYPPHVPQTAHSTVYPSSPSSSRPHRHHSHHHSTSPNHSPKMADGFTTTTSTSSTSAGHNSQSGHYSSSHHYSHGHSSSRSDVHYFTAPPLNRGHTMPTTL